MRKIIITAALLASTSALAQNAAPTSQGAAGSPASSSGAAPIPAGAPVTTAKDVPISDYNKGWCEGWATAATLGSQQFQQLVKFMAVLNPKLKDEKSPAGEAARTVLDQIPKSVLVPPQPGKVTLADGKVIDCLGVAAK